MTREQLKNGEPGQRAAAAGGGSSAAAARAVRSSGKTAPPAPRLATPESILARLYAGRPGRVKHWLARPTQVTSDTPIYVYEARIPR